MNYLSKNIIKLDEKIEFLTIEFKDISKSNLEYLWNLKFKTLSRNRLGQCVYNKRLIEINKNYLEIRPLEEFQDTLRHEVAHAVVFEKYIYEENWKNIKPHGKEWQEIAKSLGAIPNRCSKKSNFRPKFNYWLECPKHRVVNSWIKKPSWFEEHTINKNTNFFICRLCEINGVKNKLVLMKNT